MTSFVVPAGSRVTMKIRVDKRPFVATFETPPNNSKWENVTQDNDGMGERREFVMPHDSKMSVSFNAQYDEQIGPGDPDPKATYDIGFSVSSGGIGADRIVVPKDSGPVSRDYQFTAQ